MTYKSGSSFRKSLFLILLFFGALLVLGAGTLLTVRAKGSPVNLSSLTTVTANGKTLNKLVINSPSTPPGGFDAQRTPFILPADGLYYATHILTVPAYDWVFGCSSVSGAMIAGYYDNNGYSNMYVGPTNGSVAPANNSMWGTWSDGIDTYPNLPLAASHNGVDGRGTKGSIDDYWVSYGSTANDPYITGSWTQHSWSDGTAIGDYMKTSQSAYNNSDGSTSFYDGGSAAPYTCAQMVTDAISNYDGTYGRKLFYEARGYTVTDCYIQLTDDLIAGGFSLAQYKAEIDAGRPVMLDLYTAGVGGHTIVGVGYDDSSSTIYIHDTWDYSNHTMTWGGSYGGMQMYAASIVNLAPIVAPGAFNRITPANGSNQPTTTVLSWQSSSAAESYAYCLQTTPGSGTTCATSWTSTGTNTGKGLSGLTLGTYYWLVRAHNSIGDTYSNSTTWGSFTVVATSHVYLPVVHKVPAAPAGFSKSTPTNGAGGQTTSPTLTWGTSSGVTQYEYCLATSICGLNSTWTSVGASTSIPVSGLAPATAYYWQVRAVGPGGITYADGGSNWWFTTAAPNTGPTPGYYDSGYGDVFYVDPTGTQVLDFAIYVNVNGCGLYKITHTVALPISGNSFSFSGPFYASGTFDSTTSANGEDGLNSFNIPGCGNVSGGPWSYEAYWQNSNQPTAGPSQSTGDNIIVVSAYKVINNPHIATVR